MTITKTIGGDRLGAGKKMQQSYKTYERSNHDLSEIWRSTIAPGTLVPCYREVMLPGDTFDIDIDTQVLTYPTVGPLFGQFKMQIDFFKVPMRLYNAGLHNNLLKVGLDMTKVKLPLLHIEGNSIDWSENSNIPIDLQQINQGSLLAYLGIRGLGDDPYKETITREFNAIPYIAYWEIYKQYYANLQEEIGAFIDYTKDVEMEITSTSMRDDDGLYQPIPQPIIAAEQEIEILGNRIEIKAITLTLSIAGNIKYEELCSNITTTTNANNEVIKTNGNIKAEYIGNTITGVIINTDELIVPPPQISTFNLENIDSLRQQILAQSLSAPFKVNKDSLAPYGNNIKNITVGVNPNNIRSYYPMQGLALKTYQSDIFNNWVNTDWIDGAGGIAEVSAVDVSDGTLKIDSLNLAQKVYNMLNRVAISGGSYYNWIEAIYSQEAYRNDETPVYVGGLSREIHFQQVVNTAESDGNPLGSLGGRGVQDGSKKGGSIVIKTNEPCYVIGIISLTPRIDYSQGNRWDVNAMTMNDWHKPELDGIGYQDSITDQFAAWDTKADPSGEGIVYKSAGKLPAWINYMTSYNKTYGNFADERSEMFMTLNRRYEADRATKSIKDLTTYIDPSKFNYAFAQVDRGAQNFWIQLGFKVSARRKISAKQIPNI